MYIHVHGYTYAWIYVNMHIYVKLSNHARDVCVHNSVCCMHTCLQACISITLDVSWNANQTQAYLYYHIQYIFMYNPAGVSTT